MIAERNQRMSKTTIVACGCKSDFQDREHGKGQRVANIQDKTVSKSVGANSITADCTVCGKPHTIWK